MTTRYYILENPSPQQWRRMLDWALARAQQVEFLHFDLRGPLPKDLRPFEAQLEATFITCYYWGAFQLRTARVFRLHLNDALREFLTARPALSDWVAPPPAVMGPALYADDIPIFWTIAHENRVFLWLDEEAARAWQAQGAALKPAEDLTPPIVKPDVSCKRHSWGDRTIMILALIILLGFLGMAFFMIEGFLRLAGLL